MQIIRHKKVIVIVLSLVMISSMFIFSIPNIKAQSAKEINDNDSRVASEISNMTGVTVEEILKLREKGETWNEILDRLKNEKPDEYNNENVKRSNTLLQTEIGEDFVEQLKENGYEMEDIMEVKLLVERAVFQLNEIVNNNDIEVVGSIEIGNQEPEEDISKYRYILDMLDIKEALSYILRFNKEIDNLDKAFDEYLCALQLELDIELYFSDKEEYERQKAENMVEKGYKEVITLSNIEEKMLDNLQKYNEENKEDFEIEKKDNELINEDNDNLYLPPNPQPSIDNIKPQNPNAKIMEELEIVNPNIN